MKLYPITLERAARLEMAMIDYDAALTRADHAYADETNRVEEEWTTGKARVRERLLEGIEERRRRAREEKDADALGGMRHFERSKAVDRSSGSRFVFQIR